MDPAFLHVQVGDMLRQVLSQKDFPKLQGN